MSATIESMDKSVDEGEEKKVEGKVIEGEAAEQTGHATAETKKPKKKKRNLTINLTNCRYDSVRRVAKRFGLRPVDDKEEWTLCWIDTSVLVEKVMDMKRYQKINHFPGMAEICRKDLLGRNLTRMRKLFPKEYNFFPRTWVMPADYSDFQSFCRTKKNKTFISKPESGCQGKGIVVFKNPKEIRPGDHCVVQQYISKPFVIDGFKFDYRIYVLLTSCDPLRVYVYKDGLGRFATIKYREPTHSNLGEVCLHLTNYSLNKHSDDFVRDDESGSKRRISTVNQWFVNHGYDIDKIWRDIEDVIIKTLVAAHPVLRHNYRSCFPTHSRGSACFEILGFDILLDHKLKPWILEVNHSPSFHTDSPLDKEVKEGLLNDTLQLIDLYANDKRRCQEEDKRRVQERLVFRQRSKENRDEEERSKYAAHLEKYEKTHMGGLRRIYPLLSQPADSEDCYTKFFEQTTPLCTETASSRARAELAKKQRLELEEKAKEEEKYRNKLGSGGGGGGGEKTVQGGGEEEEETGSTAKPKLRTSPKVTRRVPFRLSCYNMRKKKEDDKGHPLETSITPADSAVSPSTIVEVEELERLAALQMRERLVKGLNISQHLNTLLAPSQSPTPLPSSLLPSSIPPPQQYTASELPTYEDSHSHPHTLPISTHHPPVITSSLIPHRRHHSHHSHPHNNNTSLKTFSAGRKNSHPKLVVAPSLRATHRPSHPSSSFCPPLHPSSSSCPPLHPSSSSQAPLLKETFGLLVRAAPVVQARGTDKTHPIRHKPWSRYQVPPPPHEISSYTTDYQYRVGNYVT